MSSSPIPPAFAEFAAELLRLEGRARAARRRELENLFNCSSSTMSRWLNARGIVFKERGDRGKRRTVNEEQLKKVFALQYSSYKLRQGPIMPAHVAIEIAEHNGIIPAGILTPSLYNQWARSQSSARDQVDTPTRHINLVSLGPNHVHQVDFSLAINWKIENNKAIYQHEIYKNKLPAEGTLRLLRLLLTDHTSGTLFPWYTAAVGEKAEFLIEGLWRAWTEKTSRGHSIRDRYPFRGVPRILMLDRGPGNKSQVLLNFLAWLGVEPNICEGPRSKGQVEGAHWWWEQDFESRFRLDPPQSIERLNDEAVEFAANRMANMIHRRTGATRTAHWEFHINRSFESQLRVPNCTFEEAKNHAVSNQREAKVYGDGTISFRGQQYRVPEALLQEKKVFVQYSPFEYPNVIVRALSPQAPPFVLQPLVRNEHGFFADGAVIGQQYKSHRDDQRTRLVKEAKQAVASLTEAERLVTRGYHLEGLEGSGIKSRETGIEAEAAPVFYGRIQAYMEVAERVGRPLDPAEKRLLRGFGEQVSEEEIRAAVAAIENGVMADVIPMRAVSL
jgi:hypothetical protein